MNKPWAWRSSANRIAPRLCRFVTPGNPDSNLPGTALVTRPEIIDRIVEILHASIIAASK